ncbi:MAG: hypothetical protein QM677_09525 [Microbacterium sp.]
MTEPQVWILMGVFSATIFAVIGVQTTAIMRVVRVEVGSLRTEMGVRFEGVDRRFTEIDRRFADVDRRLDGMSMKIDGLDRDVRYLMRRELGETDGDA